MGLGTLFLMSGISGSGKSTYGKKWAATNNADYVSRDEIRELFREPGEKYFAHEDAVFYKFALSIAISLSQGNDVVADATHLNRKSRAKTINAVKEILRSRYNGGEPTVVVFQMITSTECCKTRNALRPNDIRVPEEVIEWQRQRITKPDLKSEGIAEVVFIGEEGECE